MLVVLKQTPLFVFENMEDSVPEEKPEMLMLEDKPGMLMLEDTKYGDVANELMVPPPPQLVRQQARVFEAQDDAVKFFANTPAYCACVDDDWCNIFRTPEEADSCGLVVTEGDAGFTSFFSCTCTHGA